MANEPLLKAGRVGLEMELQGEAVPTDREGLMGVVGGGGEPAGAARDVKGVTMPVQHRQVPDRGQR